MRSTDQELSTWILNVSLHAGGFLSTLAEAAMHADPQNFAILRPVLLQMKKKYPDYAEHGRWEIAG
jgi:hypothetical protein